MAFAQIPMSFEEVRKNYKTNTKEDLPKEIQLQLDKWNEGIDEYNAEVDEYNRNLPQVNAERKAAGEKPLDKKKKKGKSTPCCMQLSLGLNGTGDLIPRNGAKMRDNFWLMGQYMILTVDELHDWFDWKFGRTDVVTGPDDPAIKGKKGILVMGSAHVELFDGSKTVQPLAAEFVNGASARPYFFYEFTGSGPAGGVLPAWLTGWWGVWDGTQYFYHFSDNGRVVYVKNWISSRNAPPPKNPGNVGKAFMNASTHGPEIHWAKVQGAEDACTEWFTQKNWTSEEDMNGKSSIYGQLVAKRLKE